MKKILLFAVMLLAIGCNSSTEVEPPLTLKDVILTKKWYSSGGFQESFYYPELDPVHEYTFQELTYRVEVYDGPCFDMQSYPIESSYGSVRHLDSDTLFNIGLLSFYVVSVDTNYIQLVGRSDSTRVLNLISTCEVAWANR